ncbi:(4Fe-4S)-binding protein [Porphyromonas levii]|uniref:(4Fe-4S)-binding protein n=1 Tax=Porphyromonas levii TaxID=28114 RepID=UPI001B8BD47A|nr:(4Fe-4S)-binding protein [Porphyromonas levii]MBR8712341.1 hypothetical protein [Porphyromonas levii]MBR8714192.1 hypothetical protein [Porphyromonas levii]MBR8726734.1 hypothetical protein [Porphyromonas levii]MBR8735039.1 hypothetical protein [Porphyromonas levii]MBR8773239.1 hypothetical protein [Porphyromonas levii]
MGKVKEYKNDEITVYWDAEICQHARKCVAGSAAFNVKARPWIDLSKDSSENLMRVIDSCPSGALKYKKNNE